MFEGNVSLAHGGGFASVRANPGERGLAGARICLIELRGDHKQLELSQLTDDGFDSLNCQTAFAPAGTGWQVLQLPPAEFRASFHGHQVSNAAAFDLHIRRIGLA